MGLLLRWTLGRAEGRSTDVLFDADVLSTIMPKEEKRGVPLLHESHAAEELLPQICVVSIGILANS
jgi:hypothetical protein